jgi:hypothetical protein
LGYADGERVYQAASGAIPEFPTLCSATVHLLGTSAQELLVWPHRVTPEGYSQHLPALVKVSWGENIREFQVDGVGKPFVFPLREVVKQEQKDNPGMESQLAVEVQFAAQTT